MGSKGFPIIAAILIVTIIVSAVGVAVMTGFIKFGSNNNDTGLITIGGGLDDDTDNGLIDDSGLINVNRPLKFILINRFTKAAGASFTCTLYDKTGINVLEPSGTSGTDGNWTTLNNYASGTELVLAAVSGENDIRHHIIVPKITVADRDAVTTNQIVVETYTIPGADITCTATPSSTGTALSDGGDWNKTVSGNTDTIIFNWNLPTNDEGFISSIDETYSVNGSPMKWNAVLYVKLYGTNYELASLDGDWDGQYAKGTSVYYYKTLSDYQIQKDALGNGYAANPAGGQLNGAGSFSFTIDATGYSGDAADLEVYIYVKSDPMYHNLKGSFGADSYAVLTSSPFTIDLVD